MEELLVGLSAVWVIAVLILAALLVLLPVFVYLAQRYLFQIREEVREIKEAAVDASRDIHFLTRELEKRLPRAGVEA